MISVCQAAAMIVTLASSTSRPAASRHFSDARASDHLSKTNTRGHRNTLTHRDLARRLAQAEREVVLRKGLGRELSDQCQRFRKHVV